MKPPVRAGGGRRTERYRGARRKRTRLPFAGVGKPERPRNPSAYNTPGSIEPPGEGARDEATLPARRQAVLDPPQGAGRKWRAFGPPDMFSRAARPHRSATRILLEAGAASATRGLPAFPGVDRRRSPWEHARMFEVERFSGVTRYGSPGPVSPSRGSNLTCPGASCAIGPVLTAGDRRHPGGGRDDRRRHRCYSWKIAAAPRTSPRVTTVIDSSARAPTTKGRSPCFFSSRKSVLRPTPAKVSRNAQRERIAQSEACGPENAPSVASSEMKRNPSTNLGNFCQTKSALFVTSCALPFDAQ